MAHTIAKYIRLSLEDDKDRESESIANQRMILNEYIDLNKEFIGWNKQEFIDDGYTGTNLNRPGLKELMKKIRYGQINCIIVKDFSRFTRSHIDLGDFLENLFPTLGVRFIAVNDCYDSFNEKSNPLEIPFKGLLYDLYSKDLSQKVKGTKQLLMSRGETKIGSYIYGYKKDSEGRLPYIVDEEAAANVRWIFEQAEQGIGPLNIAKCLTEKGVFTPSLYKKQKGIGGVMPKRAGNVWSEARIREILKDERYIGTLILGKTETASVRKPLRKREEEWYKFENKFEPIISKDLFAQVQLMRKSRKRLKGKKSEYHMFYKKVMCGSCGMFLHHICGRNGRKPYFFCNTKRMDKSSTCFSENIQEERLAEAIFIVIVANKIMNGYKTERAKPVGAKQILLSNNSGIHIKKQEEFAYKRSILYKKWRSGEILKERYIKEKDLLAREEKSLLADAKELCISSSDSQPDLHMAKQSGEKLTREMLNDLIKEIIVYNNERIMVRLNFYENFNM